MARRRHPKEVKEVAIARLTLGDKVTHVAKDLGIPYGTVSSWKFNLDKIKQRDGSLGYHAEEKKKFVEKAWKIIHRGLRLLDQRLEDVEKPKDLAVIIGILYDKNIRAVPEAPKGKPAVDLSGWPTEKLRAMVVELERTLPGGEPVEVLKAESREVDG